MTETALTERITRSLAYMLRHQPEAFDLELDAHGFADVGEVVRALNERLGEPVHEADLEEAVQSGDRERYEIERGRIRALYGHSIPVEPGPASKPPEVLYVAIPEQDLDRASRFGLRGGRRRFLHLALSEGDARESGRRIGRDYAVLSIRALDAWEEGVNFYDRRALWLAEEIPTHLLEVGETFHDGREPRPRGGSSAGGDRRGRRRGPRRGERSDEGGRSERSSSGDEDRSRRGRRGRGRGGRGERGERGRDRGGRGDRGDRGDRGERGDREDRREGAPAGREAREDSRDRSSERPRRERPERDRREPRERTSERPRPERAPRAAAPEREPSEARPAPARSPEPARRPASSKPFGAGVVEARPPREAAPETKSPEAAQTREAPERRPDRSPEPEPREEPRPERKAETPPAGGGFGAGL